MVFFSIVLSGLSARQGMKETKEDRQRDRQRAEGANAYDTFDMRKDMHWSDKKREEMTERDWRIFREDFSISYKGAALGATAALPLRNWEEGSLPQPLMQAIERQVWPLPPAPLACWLPMHENRYKLLVHMSQLQLLALPVLRCSSYQLDMIRGMHQYSGLWKTWLPA